MTSPPRLLYTLLTLGLLAPAAWADDASPFSLDLAAAYAQPDPGAAMSPTPPADAGPPPTKNTGPERRFGRAGSQWWSIGPAIGTDFDNDTDLNLHGIYSLFIADSLEFGVEAAGWYFNQEGRDTGGLSGSMIFRWHLWHWDRSICERGETYRNTFFADTGIGVLASFDNVPEDGTGFNFLPRLGLGYTHALTDSEEGARLTLGLRWHHISNARIEGNARNPARDGLMFYAEIQFPF